MNVSSTATMQQTQTRKMDGTGGGQGNGAGKMMQETMQSLPQDAKAEIKSLMQTLDPAAKKDAVSQIAQIDKAAMSAEDLTAAIMDILNPTQAASASAYSTAFSVYA